MNRRAVTAALVLAPALMSFRAAAAETYPARPIRILVMYPPGGGADSMNRVIAEKLGQLLGQPVIVENRPGGAGVIAAHAALAAAADGYTLLHAGTPIMTLAPKLSGDPPPYAPGDFIPIASLTATHYLLVARADFPANDLNGLLAVARQRPGEIGCGNWGPISITRAIGEMLSLRTGAKFLQVPYRGEAPLTTDLLGGQVPLGWITLPVATEHIKAGKLKAIGIASASRNALLPDVLTFVEQGLADFTFVGWSGLFAVKGTPREIIDKLHVEIDKAVAAPDVAARLKNLGLDPMTLTTEAFGEIVRRENLQLAAVLDVLATEMKK